MNTSTETELAPHIRLQLNIDKPDFDDCWSDGYQCALRGLDESENPYKTGTQECKFWEDGWWAGFYGEEPLFELAQNLPEVLLKKVKNDPVICPSTKPQATNDHAWQKPGFKKWAFRVVKLTGLIAVVIAAYEISDLAA